MQNILFFLKRDKKAEISFFFKIALAIVFLILMLFGVYRIINGVTS